MFPSAVDEAARAREADEKGDSPPLKFHTE